MDQNGFLNYVMAEGRNFLNIWMKSSVAKRFLGIRSPFPRTTHRMSSGMDRYSHDEIIHRLTTGYQPPHLS